MTKRALSCRVAVVVGVVTATLVGVPGAEVASSSPPTTFSFTGPPQPIPDANPAGVNIPVPVAGLTDVVKNLTFSFDGTSCTSAVGATTVGLDHTWVGDLVVKLTSPSGTTVTLADRPGGQGNAGNNFCQTVLDDGGATSIQNIQIGDSPWTGTFAPANPLSRFRNEAPNGTWILNVADLAIVDTGSVRGFSLVLATGPNTAPSANGDGYQVITGRTLNVPAPGVLGNDSDPEADPLTAALVSGPTHGSLTLAANGGFSYKPTAGYTGPDSFTYQADDGALSSVATVAIDVLKVTASVADVSKREGSGGVTTATLTVKLSAPAPVPLSIHYATADGTALAGADYDARSGNLPFSVGRSSMTVNVPITADLADEPAEAFSFTISSTSPVVSIPDPTAQVAIVDDDPVRIVSIAGATLTEPNAGTSLLTFTLTLDQPAAQLVTAAFTTVDGSAVAPGDYVARSGNVQCPAGTTNVTFAVKVTGDVAPESTETFGAQITNVTGAFVGTGTATGTILDDD